ncbi:separin, partial [Cetorhinus maximus]
YSSESRARGRGRIQPRRGRLVERQRGQSGEGETDREEPPDFLRVRPLSSVQAVSGLGSGWAQAASPVLKPRPSPYPAPLRHPAGCPCPLCSDLPLTATCLRWALARGRLEGEKGEEGRRLLEAVRERCWEQGARFAGSMRALALGALQGAVRGVPGREPEAPLVTLGPLSGILAQTYSQSAWLSLGSDPPSRTWQLLESGLRWFGQRGPGSWGLEHSRAVLLLTRAAAMVAQLASRRRCGVRVSARVRTRLRKRFDDSDVEKEEEEEQQREDAPQPARGKQLGPLPRGGRGARQGAAKHPRQNRSAARKAPAPAPAGRPEEAARGTKKRAGRRRNTGATGIEVLSTSDTEQQEQGPPRAAVLDVPECEVLRRCDSTLNPGTPMAAVEREGRRAQRRPKPPTAPLTPPADAAADLEAVSSCLSQACSAVRHCPPSALYPRLCQLMALCQGTRQPYTTAYLLSESLAVTARHQMRQSLHRKSQKMKKEQGRDVTERLHMLTLCDDPDSEPRSQYLSELDSLFEFSVTESAHWPQEETVTFKKQLQQIPDGVVVCLLTLVSVSPRGDSGELLLLSRLQKGRIPVTVQIPAAQDAVSVNSLLGQFDTILKEQKEISNLTELKAWWDGRSSLDQRMRQLVESLETDVLGCWKGLLLPGSGDPQLESEAASLRRLLADNSCEKVEEELIKAALGASRLLTPHDIQTLADELCGGAVPEVRLQLEGAVHRLKVRTDQPSARSSQLVLVLDKHLQRLPWESIPSLRAHRVSRLPSFQFLLGYAATGKHRLRSVLTEGVNPSSVFYVLNPQGNLPNTEKTFKDWFQRRAGWEGVVGCGPTEQQLRSVLSNRDLYLYAGHGAGVRFLEGQEVQKLSCRAASLLVGCSSAALALRGDLEGAGIVLKYMMAGCPFFLGNLWDVTDKDIDRYMEQLLRSWLEAGPNAPILDYVSRARQAPKLKYLIGASPVVYGLSVSLQ